MGCRVSSNLDSSAHARRSEVHGISQRARQRRLRAQHARGGIFPLPHVSVPGDLAPSVSQPVPDDAIVQRAPRYAVQRRRRRVLRAQRVNTLVDCVNRLACAPASEGPIGHVAPARTPASPSQDECLASFSAKVRRAGQPPPDLSPSAALAELLQAKDLYSQEPQHLASYDPSLLKILSASAQPREAKSLLPAAEAAIIAQPSALALDSEALESLLSRHEMPRPYWDPVLRRGDVRRDFLKRLARVGLLVGCEAVHSQVGFFCVKKKGGKQRLIVDARMANFLMRLPPKTRLGSAAAIAELRLSDEDLQAGDAALDATFEDLAQGIGETAEISVRASAADVDDSFYQFFTPQLASWFAVPERYDLASLGITQVWSESLGRLRPAQPGECAHVGFSCLPMGWSWALHFCHSAVSHIARTVDKIDPESVIQERRPAPIVRPGRPALGVYVDNVYSIACQATDSLRLVGHFVEESGRRQLRVHWEYEDAGEANILGVELDGEARLLRPSHRRLWRVHRAAQALLGRAEVHFTEMQVWVGHYVNLCQLCRPLLSVLESVYAWIVEANGRRAPLWPSVREEIWMASHLCFLAETNLGLPWSPIAYVSDSSDFAYSVMWTRTDRREATRDGQYRERWRFAKMEAPSAAVHLDGSVTSSLNGAALVGGPVCTEGGFAPSLVPPQGQGGIGCSTQFGQAILAGLPAPEAQPRLGRTASKPSRLMVDVELLRAIPEISSTWETRRRWRTYREGPWRWPQEHINLKEGRASLMALERHARDPSLHHCRLFQLSDNLVSVLAFDKGRSKSWALNALCRRACALQISCQHFLAVAARAQREER